jgi:hypothetical protein
MKLVNVWPTTAVSKVSSTSFRKSLQALLATTLLLSIPAKAFAGGETVVTAATGGEAINAATAGGAWTQLSGPVIDETYARDIGFQATGTIVLNAPSGFEFNATSPVNVRVGGLGPKPINGEPEGTLLAATVTASSVSILITAESRGGQAYPGYLVWEGIQVRPTASSPLTSGHLTQTGTCNFRNLMLATGTWGLLRTVGSTPVGYVVTGPRSVTAGEPITITITKVDQYGNPVAAPSTETLLFTGLDSIGAFSPSINGSADAFSTGVAVTFDENGTTTVTLIPYAAGSSTLEVTDSNLSITSLPLTINPAAVSGISITLPEENLVYGTPFEVSIQSRDAFGNSSTVGLPQSLPVTLESIAGAILTGSSLTQDIGTDAGNGRAQYEGLIVDGAGETTISAQTMQSSLGSITLVMNKLARTPLVNISDKVYDGTTAASIKAAWVNGALPGDAVTVICEGAALFDSKHVGFNKQVIVTGLALKGADAGNYTLSTTTVNTHATITPRHVTIQATADKKTYDGTPASKQSPKLADLIPGDSAIVVQFFGDKRTGAPKTLIPAGALEDGNNGNNYAIAWKDTLEGIIEPRPLEIVAVASSKVYDGTTTAAVSLSDNRLTGDQFVVSYAAAEFNDSNVGVSKQVLVTGIALEGSDAQNYVVPSVVTTTAAITPAPLLVRADDKSRPFGTANPPFTGSLEGVCQGDLFTVHYSTSADSSRPVGTYAIAPEVQDPQSRLMNYALTAAPGVLTVLPSSSEITVLASAYPSLEGSNVAFTVIVAPENGTYGVPTGTIRFLLNGQAHEDCIPLVKGTAVVQTSALPKGQNIITVEYAGDASFEPDTATVQHLVAPVLPHPMIIGITREGSNLTTIRIQGNYGWRYVVQATTDLAYPITWENVATNTVTNLDGTWTYSDDMTSNPQRFFRAVNAEEAN